MCSFNAVSEAMHHLGVPTTRALSVCFCYYSPHCSAFRAFIKQTITAANLRFRFPCLFTDAAHLFAQVVRTGQAIRRAWYNPRAACAAGTAGGPGASVGESVEKRPPDQALLEPGAILCRVSRSFLRFGHLELFAQRQEFEQLRQLADFVCFREFPELLDMVVPASAAGAADASKTVAENQSEATSTMIPGTKN